MMTSLQPLMISSPRLASLPSLQTIRAERTYRRLKASLTEWARLCGYHPAAHHRLLIAELEKVARGETTRLAIFMPPGSAKSTYASVLFPPWLLANSCWNILAASHTSELATRWGRRIRNLITEHADELRIYLATDSKAADRWALIDGAEYYAAGVGTGIAGFRARLGLGRSLGADRRRGILCGRRRHRHRGFPGKARSD